ncbi:MAG: hypothetical protein GVY28_13070, partial [Alphaproteobacteria bacterium]|nr:hypothetical protein [Alphaproteobacteria bacterium]
MAAERPDTDAAPGAAGFAEAPPWIGGDLQTLRNTILRSLGRPPPDLSAWPADTLWFTMTDGTGDRLIGRWHRPPRPTGRPLALLIHGLTGCEDSLYLLSLARTLLSAGHPVLRLNLRGAGPSRPVCKAQYHAGRSEDLAAVLDQLPAAARADGVVAAAFALGANMLLKHLGEAGADSPLIAAAAVSAPIDLKATQVRMMAPRNRVYHRWLLKRMVAEATAPAADWTEQEKRRARHIRTVYAFDDAFVAPKGGFGTAEVYYARCSAERFLPAIRTPTLVIHALDDPWIPPDAYQRQNWPTLPALTPRLTPRGGHV